MKQPNLVCAGFLIAVAAIAVAAHVQQPAEQEFLIKLEVVRPEMLVKPTPQEGEVVGQHFARLQQLVRDRVVILAGRTLNTDASSFGIVILRAPSESRAREIMNGDPAVRNGVMKATLFPYRVAVMEGRPVE